MHAIEIQFTIDGKKPGREALMEAVWKLISESGYIGSEDVDGTDEWGLEIGETNVLVFETSGGDHLPEAEEGPAEVGIAVERLVSYREAIEMEISEQRAVADSLEKDGFSDIAKRTRQRVVGLTFAKDYFCEEIPEANP